MVHSEGGERGTSTLPRQEAFLAFGRAEAIQGGQADVLPGGSAVCLALDTVPSLRGRGVLYWARMVSRD